MSKQLFRAKQIFMVCPMDGVQFCLSRGTSSVGSSGTAMSTVLQYSTQLLYIYKGEFTKRVQEMSSQLFVSLITSSIGNTKYRKHYTVYICIQAINIGRTYSVQVSILTRIVKITSGNQLYDMVNQGNQMDGYCNIQDITSSIISRIV